MYQFVIPLYWPSPVLCMDIPHISAGGYWGCFQFSPVGSNAALDICMPSFRVDVYFQFSWDYTSEWTGMGWVIWRVRVWHFEARPDCFPKWRYPSQACILDLAVHVLSIPEPGILTASPLIRQLRPRGWVRSKKPRVFLSLPPPGAPVRIQRVEPVRWVKSQGIQGLGVA